MKNLKIIILIIYLSVVTVHGQVIKEKNIGIEVSILGLATLISKSASEKYFSTTLSYFNNENNTVLSIPISYYNNKLDSNNYMYSNSNAITYHEKILNIDIQYKKNILYKKNINLFFGPLLRYTYIDSKVLNSTKYAKLSKYGLGINIGMKFLKKIKGYLFYVGPSISIGKYFGSNSDVEFRSNSMSSTTSNYKKFIDIEIFKIGYRF